MPPNLLSVTEVAKRLGISKSTAYSYVNKGYLKPDVTLPSGVVKFTEETINNFITTMKGDSVNE